MLLDLATTTEKRHKAAPLFVLGCFEDLAPWRLAPALKRLGAALPSVEFQGHEGRFSELARALSEGRTDLAISYDIGFDGSFKRRKIGEISPVAFLCGDHPLAGQTSVELKELINYPILLSTEKLSEGFIRNLFERLQLMPTVYQKVASLEMMRSLAAHGMGVGISCSRPPGNISYDGRVVVTVPIITPDAITDIKLLWSALREPSAEFDEILNVLVGHENSGSRQNE